MENVDVYTTSETLEHPAHDEMVMKSRMKKRGFCESMMAALMAIVDDILVCLTIKKPKRKRRSQASFDQSLPTSLEDIESEVGRSNEGEYY